MVGVTVHRCEACGRRQRPLPRGLGRAELFAILLADLVRAMAWAELDRLDELVARILARHPEPEAEQTPHRDDMH
jgi:hypothetical protein